MSSRPHNIQASDDLDALRLLIETAKANSLPDDYEAKVTIGFMRGLFEQLEALQAAARKFLASGNEIDLADLTTPGEYTWDLIPYEWPNRLHTDDYPASRRDCPTCDGIGAQAGAHTERVEPCPTCAGSGKS